MLVRVLYHDNCFDGATSAALFSEMYRRCISPDARFEFAGLNHGPGDVFAGAFRAKGSLAEEGGVVHACVDFRYSSDERLDFWFDHHQSAFMSPADQAHFEQVQKAQHFYNPRAQSCSKFLAESCATAYGFDGRPFDELITWADLIDGAKFRDPQQAVECSEPALQLMLWVEANRDPSLKKRFIADLTRRSLSELAAERYIQDALSPLRKQSEKFLVLMRERCHIEDGVVTYDISDQALHAVSKFVPYYLFPDAHYVVGVMQLPSKAKISVGSNPWHAGRRTANIATICARHGGGGHPAVGAIALPASELTSVQAIAQAISTELRQAARSER